MSGPVAGAVGYATAFALIESIGALNQSVVSVALHGVLIVVLLVHGALRSGLGALPAALAVVSLLRVLSLGMPFAGVAAPVRAALVSVPLLLSAALALRLPGLSVRALGLRPRSWRVQALIGLSGLPLGLLVAQVGAGQDAAGGSLPQAAGFALAWVFAGAVEELVFRGVLQQAAAEVLGRGAVLLSSGVFAAAYVGDGSAAAVAVAAGVGLLFGVCAQQTRSIVGVGVAHALLNAAAVLLWPRLLP